MSRPWMPIYWGDYFADTGHLTTLQHGAYLLLIAHCWQHDRLPEGDRARAAAARMSLREWQKIKAPVEAFFRPDGSHKRIEREAIRTDQKIMQRAIAGQRGGFKSGITRAIQAANRQRGNEANEAKPKQTPSKVEANPNQTESEREAATKQPGTNYISKIDSSYGDEPAAAPKGTSRESKSFGPSPFLVQTMMAKGAR